MGSGPFGCFFDRARIDVVGSLATFVCTSSFHAIDVSDPSAPTSLAPAFRIGRFPPDVALLGAAAYVGDVSRADWLDVTDPAAPLGPYFLASLLLERIEVADDFALRIGTSGVRVLDAAEPFAPRDLGGVLETGYGGAMADGHVYLAAGTRGLRIFDLGPEYTREIPVDVRIGNGNGRDLLNPGRRGVPNVALQGSGDLDVSEVDPETLAFGPGRAPVVHVVPGRRSDRGGGSAELHLQFRTEQTGIGPATPEACLCGETYAGHRLAGCVALATVPARPPAERRIQLPAPDRAFRARR